MADGKRAIRDVLNQMGMHVTTKQIVAALEKRGVEVSEAFISRVRGQMARELGKAEREKAKRPPEKKSRRRPQQRKIPPHG